MENSRFTSYIEDSFSEWVEVRRHLHQYPELSFKEHETAKYILQKLDSYGIKNIKSGVAGTGIVIDIEASDTSLPWVLLRADMDALPIVEENNVPYKSKNHGVMHACGHDVHTTVMLGVVKVLNEFKERLNRNVRVIFQPGEELLPGGASLMIKEGILDDHNFEKALALHVFPDLPAGKVGFRSGMYMASCDEIYIEIQGKGGHGAMPHNVVDPVLLACQTVVSLQQVVSRKASPDVPTVLSFGKISAEGATNVIPSKVNLEGTFRTYDELWRKEAHEFIKNHVNNLAQAVGAKAVIDIAEGYPYLYNNEKVTEELKSFAQKTLGKDAVVDLSLRPTGEDFAFIAQKVPSCFFRLGTGFAGGENFGVHHPRFDVDENAIKTGVALISSFLFS